MRTCDVAPCYEKMRVDGTVRGLLLPLCVQALDPSTEHCV